MPDRMPRYDEPEMLRLSAIRALVLTAVLSALVAGCGGSTSTSPPVPALSDLTSVAQATRSAESAQFALDLTASFGDQDLTMGASGAFDSTANRARMRFDMSALAEVFGGFGAAFGAKTGDLEGFDDPSQWQLDAIQDGTLVYLRFPLLFSELPDGKEWVKADAAQLAQQQGADLGQLGSFARTDPREVLDALEAVAGELEVVGRESVRGEDTTHYRAQLDPAEIAAEASATGAGGDLLGSFEEALAQAGLATIPVDVWVGDDGLLRKLELDVQMTPQGQSTEATMRLVLELYDYGADVDVSPPDAALVVDAATLPGAP